MSVSDKPEFILETTLDCLSETLDISCSWVHLAGKTGKNPNLVSQRNFTEDIFHEMTRMNKSHPVFKEVVGLGNRIVIPNLSLDGAYSMGAFEKAGFFSLVAVPITTYKVLGILGVADKKKRRFGNDFAQLLSVIGNLVGVSLTRITVPQESPPEKVQPPRFSEAEHPASRTKQMRETAADGDSEYHDSKQDLVNEKLEIFNRHAQKMGRFRRHHK